MHTLVQKKTYYVYLMCHVAPVDTEEQFYFCSNKYPGNYHKSTTKCDIVPQKCDIVPQKGVVYHKMQYFTT